MKILKPLLQPSFFMLRSLFLLLVFLFCNHAAAQTAYRPIDDSVIAFRGSGVITIDARANDGDSEALGRGRIRLLAASLPPASQGTAAVIGSFNPFPGTPNDRITFTPNPGFSGIVTFQYDYECTLSVLACLTQAPQTPATVTINIFGADPDSLFFPAAPATPITSARSVGFNDVPALLPGIINDIYSIVTPASNGTATMGGSGIVTYAPNVGFFGVDSIVYQRCIRQGSTVIGCVNATATLTVVAAIADSATTSPGTPVVVNVKANDANLGAGLVNVNVTTSPSSGSVSTDLTTGNITYTPNVGFSGVDTFVYEVCRSLDPLPSVCSRALVTVTVTGAIANPDAATTSAGQFIDINVIANDAGATRVNTVTVQPANGSASVATPPNLVRYTPNPGFSGVDTFTYQICPGNIVGPGCATALVTVTVTAGYAANPDTATTSVATPVIIDVTANDTNVGAVNSISVQAVNGIATANAPSTLFPRGNVTYTPNAGFAGSDTFEYRVCPVPLGIPCSATALVTVTVTSPFVANPDSATTSINTPVDISVLANDTTNSIRVFDLSVSPNNGTAVIVQSVSVFPDVIRYTPNTGFFGTDTFTYRICPGNVAGTACRSAIVTVTVTAPLAANPDTATTTANTPVSINVLANDTGNGSLNAISTQANNGNAVVIPATGTQPATVTYTPNVGFVGTDTFSYRLCPGAVFVTSCLTAQVTVTVTGAALTAVADAATTPQNTAVTVNVLANDTSTAPQVSLAISTQALNGTATASLQTSSVTYTPNAGFFGTDSATYTICRGNAANVVAGCASAAVTFTVTPAPITANNDVASTTSGVAITVPVLDNDINITPVASFVIVTQPTNGAANTNANSITYTPGATFVGSDSLRYQVCRRSVTLGPVAPQTVCATAQLNIGVQTNLQAIADSAITYNGTTVTINVLANDVNATGVTLSIASQASAGTASVNGTSVVYTPSAEGIYTFTYSACTASAQPVCASAPVTVEVRPRPVVLADSGTTRFGASTSINIVANDANIDPNSLVITVPPLNGRVVLTGNGTAQYVPLGGFVGTDRFTYQACALPLPGLVAPCSTAVVTVVIARPIADLEVNKFVVGDVTLGAPVQIAVQLTNLGPDPSAGRITLVDTIGAGIENVVITPSNAAWTCALAGNTITCSSATSLAAGAGFALTIDATISKTPSLDANGLCGSSNSAAVSITDGASDSRDTNAGNNQSSASFKILPIAPIASSDSVITLANRPVSINVVTNDRANTCGAKIDETSIVLGQTLPANSGTFSASTSGTITFQPASNFKGVARVTYTVKDAAGIRSNVAELSVNVVPPAAFVSNFLSDSITILDTDALSSTASPVRTLTVPAQPDGVLVASGGESIFVASYTAGVVTQLDPLTNSEMRRINVGGGPLGLDLHENTLLVAQYDAGSLSQVPLNGGAAKSVALGVQPAGIAVDAARNRAYVSLRGEKAVAVVDLASNALVRKIAVGNIPAGIVLNPARNEIYVAASGANRIDVISTTSDSVVAQIAVSGQSPGALALAPNSNRLFVTNYWSDNVNEFDMATRALVRVISVGKNPTGLALDPSGARLLVSNFGSDTLSIIPLADPSQKFEVRTGDGPVSFGRFVVSP